ncbi:MAG: PFL family protein [Bombilactobacillus mellifer]|nr:PFL family protein [Bombilactobacillus mellifer]
MEKSQIIETIRMVRDEHLDIRTITLGLSLLDCVSDDPKKAASNIYEKITHKAQNIIQISQNIEEEYGIPITNKRISVTPISLLVGQTPSEEMIIYAQALDKAGKAVGVDFIGGYSALVQKGMSNGDKNLIASLPQVLTETKILNASVNIGSTKAGINLDAVSCMGKTIKRISKIKAEGNAKLVVFANAVEDNPFMAGAFHGISEGENFINIGISGPGVVKSAIKRLPETASIDQLCQTIKKTAFKITRLGQFIGSEAAKRLGYPFGIVDLSLAPTPARGDSVAEVLEAMGLEKVGTHGTTAALMMLNDAVKKGGVMASLRVGGLSGAFIPVSEDAGMIDSARDKTLNIDKLEAMTAVCSVGLDMVAVPGEIPSTTIAAIIADEAAIGVQNNKTTAVRILPIPGGKVGDTYSLGGLLGNALIMPYHQAKSDVLIKRGGFIPAPIHSFKN